MIYDNDNIYYKYAKQFSPEINKKIEYQIKNSTNNKYDFFKNEEDIFKFKLNNIIFPYFVCNNGYIGYDRFMTQHCTFHLIFWLHILESIETTSNEKDTAAIEIEIYFYQWISCFYNLIQKILGFIGAEYKKKRIIFRDTALSEVGKKGFCKIVDKYKELIKIIDTRNNIVHDSYVIEFDKKKREIKIRKFAFNLRKIENKDRSIKKFILDDLYIEKSFKLLMEFLNEFISLIENMENIEIQVLKERYTNEKGIMTIGFGGE